MVLFALLFHMGPTEQLALAVAAVMLVMAGSLVVALPLMPALRSLGWPTLRSAYTDAVRGLWIGGVALVIVGRFGAGWLPSAWLEFRLALLVGVVAGGVWRLRRPEAGALPTWLTAGVTALVLAALFWWSART